MRLHIGASRAQLAARQSEALRTGDWIHLGAPEAIEASIAAGQQAGSGSYLSFYYKRGNVLPFSDNHFTFVHSEHFFEHLFLDEASELFRECFRIMQPGACLRTVVPDADLRTYMEPEPVGFTTGDNRWFHPDKHKTRWSIHSLSYVLEEIGFVTHGIVYCDKYGAYICGPPEMSLPFYRHCLDAQIVQQTSYISRFHNSLIVDAIKPR